jgi:tetratricopeptide (TPR) repeat protein
MLQRASANVSKEIAWKVHLEASFIFERAAQEQAQANDDELDMYLGPARRYFALTISTCRLNLRWKVWLAAARMELYAGNKDISRTLFLRAHEVAPEKVRSLTYLDFARLHEFVGEINLARALLCKGCYYYGHDWKVWLERVLLETRGYNHKKAFEVAKRALDIHPGTGRLWSALVQLSYFVGGDDAQYSALRDALNAVPKSGEVWCEGARIHLNPFSDLFDIDRARRHLHFAEKFTPQYGDTFLEAVRLELLDQWMEPIADMIWTKTKNSFISTSKSSKNQDWLTKFITDVTLAVSCARQSSEEAKNFPGLAHETIIPKVRGKLFAEGTLSKVDFSTIVMACSNADPNYGPLWFNCRRVQTDPPRCVVEQAARVMLEELRSQAHVYLAAMVRRRAVLSTIAGEKPKGVDRRKGAAGNWSSQAVEVFDLELMEWEDRADSLLRASPSLRDIFNPVDPTTGLYQRIRLCYRTYGL